MEQTLLATSQGRKIRVAIIGAGDIGQAVAHLLEKAGTARVELWDKEPGKVPNQKSLQDVLSSAKVVFFCLPSWVFRSAVSSCVPFLKKGVTVVSLAKGIEEETHKTIDQLLEDILPHGTPFALLAGPMLAKELMEDLDGAATVATRKRSTYAKIAELFAGSGLRVEFCQDVHGIAITSVLKNVYAFTLGIADGLAWGGNKKGWLTMRAMLEMQDVGKKLGAKKGTVTSLAGFADFIATGFSCYSRNRRTGDELVRTGECNGKSEGSSSFVSLAHLLGGETQVYPLAHALKQVLVDHEDVRLVFDSLFNDKT